MATFFRNTLRSDIGNTLTTVLTTGATSKTTVIGLSLTNLTEVPVQASVQISDPNGGGAGIETHAYYIKNVVLPPNQSLRVINGGEKLVLGSSTDLKVKSNAAASLDLVMSYVEII
jgi:hypothetical protein